MLRLVLLGALGLLAYAGAVLVLCSLFNHPPARGLLRRSGSPNPDPRL